MMKPTVKQKAAAKGSVEESSSRRRKGPENDSNLPAILETVPTVAPAAGSRREGLEARIGWEFHEPNLLSLALTHSSYVYEARLGRAKTNNDEPNQPGTDNEQLEFLGDAVLGLAVTELLLKEFPSRSEGELTRIRSSLVSRKRMAEFGEALGLGDLLLMGKSAETGDGRRKAAVLANSAEALLGAMYLDVTRGPDARARTAERALRVVRETLRRLLVEPDLPGIRAELASAPGRSAMRDAKSRLQERVQAERAGRLFYADVEETGPAHARLFTVEARLEAPNGAWQTLARANGGSKKEAQQAAAEQALQLADLQAGGGRPENVAGSAAAEVQGPGVEMAGVGQVVGGRGRL